MKIALCLGIWRQKIPNRGYKKIPERSGYKKRTFDFSETNAQKFFPQDCNFFCAENKKICAENKRILRRIFSDYNYNFFELRDFSFLKQERKLV